MSAAKLMNWMQFNWNAHPKGGGGGARVGGNCVGKCIMKINFKLNKMHQLVKLENKQKKNKRIARQLKLKFLNFK